MELGVHHIEIAIINFRTPIQLQNMKDENVKTEDMLYVKQFMVTIVKIQVTCIEKCIRGQNTNKYINVL